MTYYLWRWKVITSEFIEIATWEAKRYFLKRMQHRVLIINGAVHYIQVLMAMFVTLYTYVIDSQVKFSLVAQEK